MLLEKITLCLLTFILLVPVTSVPGQTMEVVSGVSKERLAHLQDYMQEETDSGNIPGAVAMVMRNGELVYSKTVGYSNTSEESPMNEHQLFYIQSMTKPIISVAFMMLYEEGHFLLTDPVSDYIPAFEDLEVCTDLEKGVEGETTPLKRAVTIADLLTHTAGLSHGLGSSKLDQDYRKTMYGGGHTDIESRVEAMLTLPLLGQPGEQWYYSAAPDVLSVLIEQFSGISTDQFLRERIFEPLGMEHTGYNLPGMPDSRLVDLHYKNADNDLVVSDNQQNLTGNTVWSGVNGLFSTAQDYLRFCQLILNEGAWNGEHLLSRKTIELMTRNHVSDLFGDPGVGFGLGFAVVENVAESELVGSEGLLYWSGAYNTHFFIDPKENMAAVFMTQTVPHDFYYHKKMRQLVMQAIVD